MRFALQSSRHHHRRRGSNVDNGGSCAFCAPACGYWPAKLYAADLLEHLGRLALGMQDLTGLAAKGLAPEYGLDPVALVVIGDRRKPHDLPLLLRQHMADEVVIVQSVHDQHDRTQELVVEPVVVGCRATRWPLAAGSATTPPRALAGRR
jgi:hypothetical protein